MEIFPVFLVYVFPLPLPLPTSGNLVSTFFRSPPPLLVAAIVLELALDSELLLADLPDLTSGLVVDLPELRSEDLDDSDLLDWLLLSACMA